MNSKKLSTGFPYLDTLTGGINLGDNVVWQLDGSIPIHPFVREYFNNSHDKGKGVIFISFNYSPQTIKKQYDFLFKNFNCILIDAFTHGKGKGDEVFKKYYDTDRPGTILIKNPKDIQQCINTLNEIETTHQDGSFYIFDSLTGMNELWKNETTVLDFFAFTCPKLYDLNTIAFWVLEKEAHTREFMAGLAHITQNVFTLQKSSNNFFKLYINKMDSMPSLNETECLSFDIHDGEVQFKELKQEKLFNIGKKVKEQRKVVQMTQADLASRLGITAGAVSQIENDITSPSLQTLSDISKVFSKPVQYFLGNSDHTEDNKNFTILRYKDRFIDQRNMKINELADNHDIDIKPALITIESGSTVYGPPRFHKGEEYIYVISGSLSVTIDSSDQQLMPGDSIYISQSVIESLANEGPNNCSFIHLLI